MGVRLDLTGHRYGRLLVQAMQSDGRWVCLCDCGKTTMVSTVLLRHGGRRSCRCLWRENHDRGANFRHGDAHAYRQTKEYRTWQNIKRRCYDRSNSQFNNYGGRGIIVCARWREDYMAFLADMGRSPQRYSIERRDNDGPYAPDNCYWADRFQQANNTRANRWITFNGATHTMAQWAVLTGIAYHTLKKRLNRHWTPEKALTTP